MINDLVLTENTATDYTKYDIYNSYIENRIEQEVRINNLISECSILNEANTGIVSKTMRIKAIYEAKLTDKIKEKFKKAIEFIKNLWGKFMANMRKVLLDEADYLEKYKDIILNKKGSEDINVSYNGNYDKARVRIIESYPPQFDWNTMSDALSDKEDPNGKFFALAAAKNAVKGFDYDDTDDLSKQLKTYFIGGEDGQTEKTLYEMDLKTMYTYCKDFKKIENITKKDFQNIESSVNKIQNAINTKIDDATKAAETQKIQESYIYEADENPSGGTDGSDQNNDQESTKTGLTTSISKATSSTSQQNRLDSDEKEKLANDQSDAAMKSNNMANEKDDADKKNLVDTVANNYLSIAKCITTAKWTGAEQIAKDFMKIIHLHVKSYIGKDIEQDNKGARPMKYKTGGGNNNSGATGNSENNANSTIELSEQDAAARFRSNNNDTAKVDKFIKNSAYFDSQNNFAKYTLTDIKVNKYIFTLDK